MIGGAPQLRRGLKAAEFRVGRLLVAQLVVPQDEPVVPQDLHLLTRQPIVRAPLAGADDPLVRRHQSVVGAPKAVQRGAGDPVVVFRRQLGVLIGRPGRVVRLVRRVPDVFIVGDLVGRRATIIRVQDIRLLIVLRVLAILAIPTSLRLAGAGVGCVRREDVGCLQAAGIQRIRHQLRRG